MNVFSNEITPLHLVELGSKTIILKTKQNQITNSSIPKIIHLTWIDNNFNTQQQFIIDRWKELHPNFEIKIWTDLDNQNLIKEFPEYIDRYNNLSTKIQKLDFIRLLYLYKFGGIYADLDVLPIKSLEPLLNSKKSLILCEEPKENAKNFRLEKIVANFLMISSKENEFVKMYIENILIFSGEKIRNSEDILKTSGPFLLTKLYDLYHYKSSILLLDHFYFNPLNLENLSNENLSDKYLKWSFAIHLFDGSWWKKESTVNNLEYLKSLINLSEKELPLISCLCVTKNKKELLEKAIECFNNQIYPNKELILIYDSDDNINYINSINQPNIIKIKATAGYGQRQTLGDLRNLSIRMSRGEWICQWDDDDIYCPTRLYYQYITSMVNDKDGSILSRWTMYDQKYDKLYLGMKRTWEGSLLYRKSKIIKNYQSLKMAEDTRFVEDNNIEENVYFIDKPELYLYRIHGNNTWHRKNFESFLPHSTEIMWTTLLY